MQTNQIRRIMCCCGNGVGTSLLMQMTIEEALEILGFSEIEVLFGPLSEVSEDRADIFVVSEEVLNTLGDLPAIGLENLMDADQAAEKLKEFLENS